MPNEVIEGNLTLTETPTVEKASIMRSTLYVDGFMRVGACAVQGSLHTSGDAIMNNDLSVSAGTSIGGGLLVQGANDLRGDLVVAGNTKLGATNLQMKVIRVESGPTFALSQEDSGSLVVLVAGTSAATITLPPSPKAGTVFWFTAHDTDVYTLSLAGTTGKLWFSNLTQSFDGVSSAVSDGTPRATLAVVFEGTNWFGLEVANGWKGL